MRKILTAAIFTLALTGLAVSAAPEAEAASIINPSKAAIVDVVNDMSAVQQVRGSNRYKEQMRFHLLQGKRGDGAAPDWLSLRQGLRRLNSALASFRGIS
jgi:hypothetical protein